MGYKEELQLLLDEYQKSSLAPSNAIVGNGVGCDFSQALLQEIEQLLPSASYLSKSWLMAQQALGGNLSVEQLNFINKALSFWNENEEHYEEVKENPSFDVIRANCLANCGELSSAFINETKSNPSLAKKLSDVQFFRMNILLEKKVGSKTLTLNHVLLLYEKGKDKTVGNIVQNLLKPKSETQAIDIWKRRAGDAREMIIKHIIDEGKVLNGTLTIKALDTNECCSLNLTYDKTKQKWLILEQKESGANQEITTNTNLKTYSPTGKDATKLNITIDAIKGNKL